MAEGFADDGEGIVVVSGCCCPRVAGDIEGEVVRDTSFGCYLFKVVGDASLNIMVEFFFVYFLVCGVCEEGEEIWRGGHTMVIFVSIFIY